MENVELAKAYVQIVPSAQGIKGSLSKALDGEAVSSGHKAGFSIAGAIKGAIAAAGIGKALQATIMEGANLEQSIGGIETLFKSSADKVKEYAKVAYKTAGVSANSYMEQVTSFSASLLQSLGGDTNKAADSANRAIMDMSDNANKMGTSIEMIQHAYQGFARGNYTMLDNLKLGYSGTKEEMNRLLSDAEKLSGVKYDISSLSDVYDAIHVIQKEMGITGTTAKEASTTIIGSFQSMKSSLSNFMGSLSLGEDIKKPLRELVSTSKTFLFNNLLPMFGNIVGQIPQILQEIIPELVEKGTEMLVNLSQGFKNAFPNMSSSLLDIIQNAGNWLSEQAPIFIEKGFEMLSNLVSGIIDSLPVMIQKLPVIISTFANIINKNFPTILKKGFDLLVQFIKGIISAIPTLIQNIPNIIRAIVDTIMAFQWLNLGKNIIDFFGKGIGSMFNFVKTKAAELNGNIITIIQQLPAKLFNFGKNAVTNMGNAISGMFGWISSKASGLVSSITTVISKLPGKLISIGGNMIRGLWNGISNMTGWIMNKIGGFAGGIVKKVKKFFGIHSPSRVFRDEVGKYLSLGLAEGITENLKPVDDAVNKLNAQTLGVMDTNVNVTSSNYSTLTSNNDSIGIEELLKVMIEDDKASNHMINRIYAILAELLPQLANMQLVTDTGVLVGELAVPLDERLGVINKRKGR